MTRIRSTQYLGLDAVELIDGTTRMVIVHAIGPRIAVFGTVGRDNLLYWDDAGEHRHGEWRMYGGHRLWTTRPDADESEETFAPDNLPCTVREQADGVEVTAPPNASRIEKSIAVTVRDGRWILEHKLRNCGSLLWAGGLWALTCTLPAPATHYRIPLEPTAESWDVLTMVIPRRWAGHTSRLDDPQFSLREDALEFRALGDEAKRMIYAPRGTIVMTDPDRGTLVKTSELQAGTYPRATNLAVYLGPRSFMAEIETMSPSATLLPGQQLVHVETWAHTEPT
ncbi:MAG: hypothetical protein M3680_06150 [Myxococcota bacterium]|nr:hypothetical protein [Myxococcota bacterium]